MGFLTKLTQWKVLRKKPIRLAFSIVSVLIFMGVSCLYLFTSTTNAPQLNSDEGTLHSELSFKAVPVNESANNNQHDCLEVTINKPETDSQRLFFKKHIEQVFDVNFLSNSTLSNFEIYKAAGLIGLQKSPSIIDKVFQPELSAETAQIEITKTKFETLKQLIRSGDELGVESLLATIIKNTLSPRLTYKKRSLWAQLASDSTSNALSITKLFYSKGITLNEVDASDAISLMVASHIILELFSHYPVDFDQFIEHPKYGITSINSLLIMTSNWEVLEAAMRLSAPKKVTHPKYGSVLDMMRSASISPQKVPDSLINLMAELRIPIFEEKTLVLLSDWENSGQHPRSKDSIEMLTSNYIGVVDDYWKVWGQALTQMSEHFSYPLTKQVTANRSDRSLECFAHYTKLIKAEVTSAQSAATQEHIDKFLANKDIVFTLIKQMHRGEIDTEQGIQRLKQLDSTIANIAIDDTFDQMEIKKIAERTAKYSIDYKEIKEIGSIIRQKDKFSFDEIMELKQLAVVTDEAFLNKFLTDAVTAKLSPQDLEKFVAHAAEDIDFDNVKQLIFNENTKTVSAILSNKQTSQLSGSGGRDALWYAVNLKNTEMVEQLLADSVGKKSKYLGTDPLELALIKGRDDASSIEIAEQLISSGFSLNSRHQLLIDVLVSSNPDLMIPFIERNQLR